MYQSFKNVFFFPSVDRISGVLVSLFCVIRKIDANDNIQCLDTITK